MMCCVVAVLKAIFSFVGTVFTGIAFVLVAYFLSKAVFNFLFSRKSRVPNGYQEQWFGKEPSPPTDDDVKENLEDASVRPFKIDVPDEVLQDLKRRLENTRFEDTVEGTKFFYGFNPNYLKKLVDYWKKEYDWRKEEKMLNQFPQFKTRIEGIDVHFLHVKPNLPENSNLKVIPLMIIHGWPGSIVEFYKLIPLMTTPNPNHNFVFEVICPSIPGFGFSESPHHRGFDARAAARIFMTLMDRIGHQKFYVQGGDWGSVISTLMARYYTSRIIGVHVNMYASKFRPWELIKLLFIAFFPFAVSKAEYKTIFPLKRSIKMLWIEGAYFHMQSTKPDTLGCGMSDSPAGMAAYLLEKFSCATNLEYLKYDDGNLTEKFTLDELLTNVMLYWINNNFTAAARFYKENLIALAKGQHEKVPVLVPSAVAVFPNEVLMVPRTCMSQQMKNLISYNIMPRGGHFAALEEPELLAGDVRQFVGKVESLQ